MTTHPSIVDTHAHLDSTKFGKDVDRVVERATRAGVTRILTVASRAGREGITAPILLSEKHPCLWAAVGVHPHEASSVDDEQVELVRTLVEARDKVVAVGEIGLDYHYNFSPPEVQRKWFGRFLEVASQTGKPVVVHVREAHGDAIPMLKDHDVARIGGVIHCFTGNAQQAAEYLDMGLALGVTGMITYRWAQELREVVAAVPRDRVLLETDCPYLAPEPHRGRRCEPADTALTLGALAALWGDTEAHVGEITTENARRVFGWPAEPDGALEGPS